MKAFADLYAALDETTKTGEKVAALARYFAAAAPADAAWAVYFLVGRKPRQVVPSARLRAWAAEAAGLSDWHYDECYHAVGDVAETIALVLPPPARSSDLPLAHWVEERLLPLRGAAEAEQKEALLRAWAELDRRQRFVWNKLITGAFRVGVSQQLVTRGLAQASGIDAGVLAHRLMGDWEPTPAFYERLTAADPGAADVSRPYPFFLAHPLEEQPAALGDLRDWQAEWKWDGIRSQLIRRAGRTFLWSRGEELVTERYPELAEAAARLPDGTALDGEILPWKDGVVLPFGDLQRRIGRKTLSKKLLREVPAVLIAYDLLEEAGADLRPLPQAERRARLEQVVSAADDSRLLLSPLIEAASWEELGRLWGESRGRRVEGMMLKQRSSPYRVGRVRGDWWKWKVSPFTVDAVLIYAQRGSGKRASLYTDYTFGLRDGGALVPVAKAYSGLTDAEIRRVDAFVRQHTVEKFGPVRTVTPELVFELAFEGIQRSARHKSGVAVRFPRILRWRTDKKADDADSLEALRRLLPPGPGT
jgi:DNA ligase-1